MNNLLVIFLMIAMSTSCLSTNGDQIEYIKVKFVDFELMTTLSVRCSEFEDYFGEYNESIISEPMQIDSFLYQLNDLEKIDSTYSNTIDTRAKVELISKNDTSLICIGYLSLEMNGSLYKTPESLMKLIEDL